jgi:hypothetical protein
MEPVKPLPPDIDGYLSKLKHKQSIFGAWNKRYFKVNVDTERIEYYKTKPTNSDEEPSGLIDLAALHAVRRFDGTSFQVI